MILLSTSAQIEAFEVEPIEIPLPLRDRLAAEGIKSLEQWQRLSYYRKRHIFGITAAHVRWLDSLAKQAELW